jgi:clostripain
METIKIKLILFTLLSMGLLFITSCPIPYGGSTSLFSTLFNMDTREKSTDWTVLFYVDGDNDLEGLLLEDMEELSQGLGATEWVNVIALVDRIDGYSTNTTILGSNFTDTRLFRIGADEIYPIPGEEFFPDISMTAVGEYNMGDAQTLKKFIEYGKKYYPADHYALIFSNHGSGVRSYSGSDPADFVKGRFRAFNGEFFLA